MEFSKKEPCMDHGIVLQSKPLLLSFIYQICIWYLFIITTYSLSNYYNLSIKSIFHCLSFASWAFMIKWQLHERKESTVWTCFGCLRMRFVASRSDHFKKKRTICHNGYKVKTGLYLVWMRQKHSIIPNQTSSHLQCFKARGSRLIAEHISKSLKFFYNEGDSLHFASKVKKDAKSYTDNKISTLCIYKSLESF
jgi:hypothetical protein